ncbi:sporulation protein YpjB [Cohnella lupini]|uniref:sporulation protein YpjB n=1 Tax=Cohnella lupini TaxID=1294267 RepID=UPI0015F2522D|nr:sporulation protein YpjB [Cohnella lupini]
MFLFISPFRIRGLPMRQALISLIVAAALCLIAPPTVLGRAPETDAKVSRAAYVRLLSATEKLYGEVNAGNSKAATRSLTEIESQLRSLPTKGKSIEDGIRELEQSVTELRKSLSSNSPDESKAKSEAAELRLAADALVKPDKPMWHRYRTLISNDLIELSQALPLNSTISGPVAEPARSAFNRVVERYLVIRTAALLEIEPWKVERADSVIRYASRIVEAESPKTELLQSTILPLQEALDGLFPSTKESSAAVVPPITAPPSWGWSAMVGSFIVTVLTWVGWRRYKDEEYSGSRKEARHMPEDAAQRLLIRWKKK